MHRGSESNSGQLRRASSPTGYGTRQASQRHQAPEEGHGGFYAAAASDRAQVIVQTQQSTSNRVSPQASGSPTAASMAGAVRSFSSGQQAHSPTRTMPSRSQVGPVRLVSNGPALVLDESACLQLDCPSCMQIRRSGFVLCRLPCGHTVRAQIVDVEPVTGWGCSTSCGGVGGRSESPTVLTAHQRERDHAGTSPPPRSILRQVSGVRNPVPSVAITAPLGSGNHPPAPLSPPRGPASPSSPQQTPGTMFRKSTSSLTSLAANALYPPIAIPREGAQSHTGDSHAAQQMTSRSSGGGGASLGASGFASPSRGALAAGSEKARKHDGAFGMRTEPTYDARLDGPRRTSAGPMATTEAEVVTDSRGDVLHKMCNVILLSPQSIDKEQQLKVRGQIIGTYWDEQNIGPLLDHPSEVQVMVTYVDASERNQPLLFPTRHAHTFGETETTEGNIIKWKASLCKVGKKFS